MENIDSCEKYDEYHSVPNQSVENIIGTSPTVMVFGFGSCHYMGVTLGLKNHPMILKVFDHTLGYDCVEDDEDDEFLRRLDGTKIYQIKSGMQDGEITEDHNDDLPLKLQCKAALVNQVLENYRAVHIEKREITPIVFCIDYENKTTGETFLPPLTSENILSKTKLIQFPDQEDVLANDLITHSEIRRAYRLCFDESIDVEIRSIAQRTFKFVKVKETTEDIISIHEGEIINTHYISYELEKVDAPWDKNDFKDELHKRNDSAMEKQKRSGKTNWKDELNLEAQKIARSLN